jgi:hypothetical protein
MEREALSLAMDGLERILGSFEKDGKVVMKSMIRNELFAEMHLLLKKAKKALAQPAQECPNLKNCKGACFQCEYFNSATGEMNYPTTQPAQEPVACVQDLDEVKRKHLVYEKGMDWKDPLYTTPPKREWVGLTNDEIELIIEDCDYVALDVAPAIEQALKEKNNGT